MSTPASPSLSCRLLSASAAAYGVGTDGTFTQREPWYATVGFTSPPTVIVGGAADIDAAIVGTNADGVIVAFRGTIPPAKTLSSVLDWIQDIFLAAPVAYVDFPGAVHSGFYAAWLNLREGVLAAVKAQLTPGTKLYVTGHSKGGSLASLGAWALKEAGYEVAGVTTFAAAHVGNTAFATAYDAAFDQVRYDNYRDLVPFLPPTPALADVMAKLPEVGKLFTDEAGWDYAAVGKLQYITDQGGVIGGEPGLDAARLGEILVAIGTGDGSEVVAAHSLTGTGGYCRGVCPEGTCASGDGSV